jgi:hypothetical protein
MSDFDLGQLALHYELASADIDRHAATTGSSRDDIIAMHKRILVDRMAKELYTYVEVTEKDSTTFISLRVRPVI